MDAETIWTILKFTAIPLTALLTFLTVNAITCRQWRKNKDEMCQGREKVTAEIFKQLRELNRAVSRIEGTLGSNPTGSGLHFLEED